MILLCVQMVHADRSKMPADSFRMGCSAGDPACESDEGPAGGARDENRPNLRSSFRNVKPPGQGDAIYGSIGFRCVADPS
jgi:formylglycine-generating enzyme required for sulfatase activity